MNRSSQRSERAAPADVHAIVNSKEEQSGQCTEFRIVHTTVHSCDLHDLVHGSSERLTQHSIRGRNPPLLLPIVEEVLRLG